jgi:hypothetical protein
LNVTFESGYFLVDFEEICVPRQKGRRATSPVNDPSAPPEGDPFGEQGADPFPVEHSVFVGAILPGALFDPSRPMGLNQLKYGHMADERNERFIEGVVLQHWPRSAMPCTE